MSFHIWKGEDFHLVRFQDCFAQNLVKEAFAQNLNEAEANEEMPGACLLKRQFLMGGGCPVLTLLYDYECKILPKCWV